MAAISFAVAATGAAMSVGSVAQCVMSVAKQNQQVEVDAGAAAKGLGVVRCRTQGRLLKAERHVTLIGDLLAVSRRPGCADTMISLRGTEVEVADAGKAVKVISGDDGATLATFWPGDEGEVAQWAAELGRSNRPAEAVPKFISIARQQREQLRADAAESEQEIKRVQSRPNAEQAEVMRLEGKSAECEGKAQQLQQDLERFKEMPKLVSLNRRQIAELEGRVQQREAEVLELQAQVGGLQDMPKMVSLRRREVASLEARARIKEGTVEELQEELQKLQDVPKMLSCSRREVSTLEAESAEKDGLISDMQASLRSLASEVPKMLTLKRRAVCQREQRLSEKDIKIKALEERLQGFQALPKILSFNRKQVAQLEESRRNKEKQLEDLRKQLDMIPSAGVGA